MGCMGSTSTSTSDATEKPELAYQFAVMETHVPSILLSQARSIGVHCQMDAAVVATM